MVCQAAYHNWLMNWKEGKATLEQRTKGRGITTKNPGSPPNSALVIITAPAGAKK
jgi:hypothetical protein